MRKALICTLHLACCLHFLVAFFGRKDFTVSFGILRCFYLTVNIWNTYLTCGWQIKLKKDPRDYLRNLNRYENEKGWKNSGLPLATSFKVAWITARVFLLFNLLPAVQKYFSFIQIHLFILQGYITNSQVGLIAAPASQKSWVRTRLSVFNLLEWFYLTRETENNS